MNARRMSAEHPQGSVRSLTSAEKRPCPIYMLRTLRTSFGEEYIHRMSATVTAGTRGLKDPRDPSRVTGPAGWPSTETDPGFFGLFGGPRALGYHFERLYGFQNV